MAASKQSFDPGLTQQFSGELRRAINKNGRFNVHRRGSSFSSWSPYLFMVDTSWPKFIGIMLLAYLLVNLTFASIFFGIGIENLVGASSNTGVGPFLSAFFFSVHTLTTVGYGSMYPRGVGANSVAGVEAMVGLMGFALGTGLLFARFSRPSARMVFSKFMVMAPYQGGIGLEFRVANERNNILMDLEAKLILMTVERADGGLGRKFVELTLERQRVYFIPLSWTIVHPVDQASPLWGLTPDDLARKEAEFLVLLKGFDETFSQFVNSRYSYRYDEIQWGRRFLPAFKVDPEGDLVIELDRLNDAAPAPLPALAAAETPTLPDSAPGA